MGTVVVVSLIPIKWGYHAETPKARREVDESAATRNSEGLETNLGFLGEPVSVVKRWAAQGMPVHREGQFVSTTSTSDELNRWLGQESGKPVHVATENTDLTAELKRGLSFVRSEKPHGPKKEQSPLSGKVKR
jgi:hypothetical protein